MSDQHVVEDPPEFLEELTPEWEEAHRQAPVSKAPMANPTGQFVVFATPCFDYNVTMYYHQSAMQTDWLLAKRGIERSTKMYGGDPYLAKVRNLLVSSCLRQFPQMTDFFFIDADVEWDPAAVLKLLDHPGDVVAGVYPKKNDNTEFPCELLLKDEKLIEQDGWYRARAVPTGFLRIKRHVLEKMAAMSNVYTDGTGGGEECWNIFEMGFCGDKIAETGKGEWWGEDYAWCKRYLDMDPSNEIWVYPDIEFGHRGGKNWRNNFSHSVKAFQAGNIPVKDIAPPGVTSAAPVESGGAEVSSFPSAPPPESIAAD